jgi:hypothetical protein|nr:MAG TPA: cell division protein [Caudoviricetes sp.]DAY12525.1 MAG TPA: cell division protein [Caudoviricetes sp.]
MRKLIIRKLGGVLKTEMDSVVGVNRVWLEGAYAKIEELEAENKKLRQQVYQQTSDTVIALRSEIARLRANLRSVSVRNKAKGRRK